MKFKQKLLGKVAGKGLQKKLIQLECKCLNSPPFLLPNVHKAEVMTGAPAAISQEQGDLEHRIHALKIEQQKIQREPGFLRTMELLY